MAKERKGTVKKAGAAKAVAKKAGAKTAVAKKAGARTAVARKAGAKKAGAKTALGKKAGAKRAGETALERLRAICLALPEATEVEAWDAPTFRVKGKIFAMYTASGNNHGGREAVWILSISLEQDLVLRARPDRYFKPPYVGPSGWIGAWLDRNPPWAEIEELIRDGWRRRAPRKVAALLDE